MIYWNHFIALEKDLETISNYIEISENNFKTYSNKLSQLFLATSSEIDVILKEICHLLSPKTKSENINEYRNIIPKHYEEFAHDKVYIYIYDIHFQPWEKWENVENPEWWQSYNSVKHKRNNYYNLANLENVLNSISALFIANYYYYLTYFKKNDPIVFKNQILLRLKPRTTLLSLDTKYYYNNEVF
jgi:hypothetical protein